MKALFQQVIVPVLFLSHPLHDLNQHRMPLSRKVRQNTQAGQIFNVQVVAVSVQVIAECIGRNIFLLARERLSLIDGVLVHLLLFYRFHRLLHSGRNGRIQSRLHYIIKRSQADPLPCVIKFRVARQQDTQGFHLLFLNPGQEL